MSRPALVAALVVALLAAGLIPATTVAQSGSNELRIAVAFPDDGLAADEQLCLALYPGAARDFSAPPLQSRCLDPGGSLATFAGIAPGTYQLVAPSVGSVLDQNRYQLQAAETSIPEDLGNASYEASLPLALTPELSGTTGQVRLNVYGCPPGTDGEGDATLWKSECTSPVAGVSLSLQGIGSIGDTSVADVTAGERATAGRVEFANLPPGEYEIRGVDSAEFVNVETNPALVVESNIDGSLGVVDPAEGISLRPSEIKNIDVFLVLTDNPTPMVVSPIPASVAIGAPTGPFSSANPSTASIAIDLTLLHPLPEVGGGLSDDAVANRASDDAAVPDS
ncbi:MAG: hypothetical protein M3464_16010 [Chloroflexota bacterium]|nr:hypothetical protein [Chloroflexota bacterium]